MGTVKQDANGVPEEWTLLHAGANRLVKNGKDYELRLSVEDLDAIVAYQEKKGEAIPIDSNHYLHILAEKHDVEESEALRLIPSGVAAMGFGTLFREGDELRIRAEWTPGAYELLKEKIFRYCSPVIRGLKEGPIRITSVAMENEPALNCEDILAAGREREEADPEDIARNTVELKRLQDPIERALGHLLGQGLWNEIVLSGEDDEEGAFERTAAAIEAKANTIAAMREGLGVSDGEPDEAMSSALASMKERAGQADALRQELDTMICAAEEKRKDELIDQGLQEGKLTHALEGWARTQDCTVLASYLEHAPAVVPGRMTFAPDRQAPKRSLSAADEEMIRKFGFDKDEYQRAMHG